MKNIFKLKAIQRIAGIIALVAVIGFSMAACGGDDSGGNTGGNTGGNSGGDTSDTFEMYANEHYQIAPPKVGTPSVQGHKFRFGNSSDFVVKVTINGSTQTMNVKGNCTFDYGQSDHVPKVTVTYSPADKVRRTNVVNPTILFFVNK
jgi:hypothetical protein